MAKARISKTEKKALETKERIDNTLKQLAATNQDQATVPPPAAQPPAPPVQYTQEQIAVHNFRLNHTRQRYCPNYLCSMAYLLYSSSKL